MTKFSVGDKVMIANVKGIVFAEAYFKDGDVTEVVRKGFIGQGIAVRVPKEKATSATTQEKDGTYTLYITDEEFGNVIKLLDAEDSELKAENEKLREENAMLREQLDAAKTLLKEVL